MSLPLSFKRGSKMSVLKDSVVLQIGRFISRHWYVAKDCGVPRPWINEQRNCGSNEHKSLIRQIMMKTRASTRSGIVGKVLPLMTSGPKYSPTDRAIDIGKNLI